MIKLVVFDVAGTTVVASVKMRAFIPKVAEMFNVIDSCNA